MGIYTNVDKSIKNRRLFNMNSSICLHCDFYVYLNNRATGNLPFHVTAINVITILEENNKFSQDFNSTTNIL